MIMGLSLSAFTTVHVVLSLSGLVTGFAVIAGLIGSRVLPAITSLFLATTLLTSVTGFLYLLLFNRWGLGHTVGVLSLAVLAPTLAALYLFRLAGVWRSIYAAGAVAAVALNAVIAILQAFAKVSILRPFADLPTIAATETVALIIFAVLGVMAVTRFRQAIGARTETTSPRLTWATSR